MTLTGWSLNPTEIKKKISIGRKRKLTVIHHDNVDPIDINYPVNLTYLDFVYYTKERSPINEIVFPDSVETLFLETNYPLDLFIFPENLRVLSVAFHGNQDIKDLNLPDSVINLFLSGDFNQDISDFAFPKDVDILILSGDFNQDVSNVVFPESLIVMGFGDNFNQDISNITFPVRLATLFLGENFNLDMSLFYDFPLSLTKIVIGDRSIFLNDRAAEGHEDTG
jgi:hypothetical protein